MIGAGFIGAEVAATCRARGLEVTVLEALPAADGARARARARRRHRRVHRDHGVDLRTGVARRGIDGDGRVERVRLGDGSTIDADVVVVGVGVVPETAWLEGSGLTLDNGVVCDETCSPRPASSPRATSRAGRTRCSTAQVMRLEHWTNATEQGVHAARRLLAGDTATPFAPVPFVWSDQYDRKIQTVGMVVGPTPTCTSRTARSTSGSSSRCSAATAGIVGALGFNRPAHVMQYRRLIAERGDRGPTRCEHAERQ